ncbi:MAG: hypothetical protein ACRCTZ_05310 [Sarcina sp.]
MKNNNYNDEEIFYTDNQNVPRKRPKKPMKKSTKIKHFFLIILIIICSLTIVYIISTMIKDFTNTTNSVVEKEVSFNAIKDTTPISLGSLSDGKSVTAYTLPNKISNSATLEGYINITNIYKDVIIFFENDKKDNKTDNFIGSLKTYNLKTKKAQTIFKDKLSYSNIQINDKYITAQNKSDIYIFDRSNNNSFVLNLLEITNNQNSRATLLTNNSLAIILDNSIIYYSILNEKIEKETKDLIFNGFLPEVSNDNYALLHVTKSFKSEVAIIDFITDQTYKFNFENSILIESMIDSKDHLIILTSNNNDFIFDKKSKKFNKLDSSNIISNIEKIERPENALFNNYVIENTNLNNGIIKIASLEDSKTTEIDISKLLKGSLSSTLTFLQDSIILEINTKENSIKRYYIMIE